MVSYFVLSSCTTSCALRTMIPACSSSSIRRLAARRPSFETAEKGRNPPVSLSAMYAHARTKNVCACSLTPLSSRSM
ncbi:hypothetical protein AXK57_22080 [Tsukamurella pulmonis]|nr:hypothetical protein AXK57_22080 [Tsukamurella pulmonis]